MGRPQSPELAGQNQRGRGRLQTGVPGPEQAATEEHSVQLVIPILKLL